MRLIAMMLLAVLVIMVVVWAIAEAFSLDQHSEFCEVSESGKHRAIACEVFARPWWNAFRRVYYLPCRDCGESAEIIKERRA